MRPCGRAPSPRPAPIYGRLRPYTAPQPREGGGRSLGRGPQVYEPVKVENGENFVFDLDLDERKQSLRTSGKYVANSVPFPSLYAFFLPGTGAGAVGPRHGPPSLPRPWPSHRDGRPFHMQQMQKFTFVETCRIQPETRSSFDCARATAGMTPSGSAGRTNATSKCSFIASTTPSFTTSGPAFANVRPPFCPF